MLYDENGIFVGMPREDEFDDLFHYGTPRHSGRYPWGSGENPYQRNADFIGRVEKLRKAKDENGRSLYSEKQIASSMGMNTSELRSKLSLARAENRAYLVGEAKKLKGKGMSTSAIARRMEMNESSVRLLLNEGVHERMSTAAKNADVLKQRVNELNYIDVGKGSEEWLGISRHNFDQAIKMLESEGYTVHNVDVKQMGTGKNTTLKVLAKPGVTDREVWKNQADIKMVKDVYSEDGGSTMRPIREYVSIDPKRVMVNYAETGGKDKDGVIELRRNVADLDLGKNNYAQVRILVDGTHYLKGMAMYVDDDDPNPLPKGVDIRFNTNKHSDTPMINRDDPDHSVLKPVKDNLENPFGANIKPDQKLTRAQRHYIGEDGQEHQSAINIVKEEGDVNDWSRTLASQFLSKQTPAMAKQQLKMKYDISKAEFDEIAGYNNPTVKASMLMDFAGRCESDAVHLAAAALPRQSNKFILPLTNIKENEIYAPDYRDGEQVALVRYPHAGIFEIPILTVNNHNAHAESVIGKNPIDAIGIHPSAAERLSGADFDGDTCLVLPTDKFNIKATANKLPPAFKSLEGFDAKEMFPKYPGMHVMTSQEKGREMGVTTNLITDMTVRGATPDELVRAVKHSMVVIDAEKHELDYKRSEQEFGIPELKRKYQTGGASTFLSRSTSPMRVDDRKEKAFSKMSPEEKERYYNGEIVYEYSGKNRVKQDFLISRMTPEEKVMYKSGDPVQQWQVKKAMMADGRVRKTLEKSVINSKKGAEMDPYSLVSGGSREATTAIERIYADHAFQMKELAREARKLARAQIEPDRDPEARKRYSKEVDDLDKKISMARKNAPLERQAQILANSNMRAILNSNPELYFDKEHYKREKGRQLEYARSMLNSKKLTIGSKDNPLTDREWEAIQAHAVSKTQLRLILANADKGRIKELAMPKTKVGIPKAKLARAKAMLGKGYSKADICDMLDISMGKLNYAMENGDL